MDIHARARAHWLLIDAAKQVEEWWLEEGMNHFNGAPAAIFGLRSALDHQPSAHTTAFRWSFDDRAIGILRSGESAISSRSIARPEGISTGAWYGFARSTCDLLNSIPERVSNGLNGNKNRETDSGSAGTADRSDDAGDPQSDGGERVGSGDAGNNPTYPFDACGLEFFDDGRGAIDVRSGSLSVGTITYRRRSLMDQGSVALWRIHAVRLNWIARDMGLAPDAFTAMKELAENWKIWLDKAGLARTK